MKNSWEEFIRSLNSEIGKHIIATDDKREKIVNLYFIFVVGIITALIQLSKNTAANYCCAYNNSEPQIFFIIITICLIVLGEIITFSIIGARKWHAEYMNCSIILQKLLFTNDFNINNNYIPKEKRESFFGNITTSRSFFIIQLGLLMLFVFIGRFFITILKPILDFGEWIYIIMFAIGTLAVLFNIVKARKKLDKLEMKFWNNPYKNWCLAGLEFARQQTDENID